MFEQTFKNIDDILYKVAGCGINLATICKQKLTALDELKKSILEKAFACEL